MYESPINIIYGQMQTQMEGDILKAVMDTGINVDKDELIRALRYDRDQYDRGFADGYMHAQQEVLQSEWIMRLDVYDVEFLECPLCGGQFYDGDNDTFDKPYNYCPNCGADMRGDPNA